MDPDLSDLYPHCFQKRVYNLEKACTHHTYLVGYLFIYSDQSKEAFKNWTEHDDAQENFCEIDGKYFLLNLPADCSPFYIL